MPQNWFQCECTSFASEATSCSGNGDVVACNVIETENGSLKAGVWSLATGLTDLSVPDLMGARDISFTGAVIVGELYTSGGAANGYYRTEELGVQQIAPPDVQRLAFGCSGDGSVLAGQMGAFPGLAFRWTGALGVETLGDIPGGPEDSGANAVSLDGEVVVGFGSDNTNFQDKFQAARWQRSTGIVGIGRLPGLRLSSAFATNGDGSVVVGNAFNSGQGGLSQRGFIWTGAAGIQDLNAVLVAQGATGFGGFQIITAQGVSADGLTIVGLAMNPQFTQRAYIARLVSIPGGACDPDVTCDGNADQDDVACLIDAVAGNPGCECQDPDFNADGNVDQDDVAALITAVAGGGCP